MANSHDDPTEEKEVTTSRRGVLKIAGLSALAATGAVGTLSADGRAQSEAAPTQADGEVLVPPGEYTWDGSPFDVPSGAAIVGDGNSGDVVFNLEGGTMDGTIGGSLENIVVRGANPNSKAGIDLEPGSTIDGFIWTEGGQQDEDRAFYTPDGGNDRVTLRNSAWAWMVNNGAYCDKPPMTIENCVSVNNNIAGIRVGHRDGTSSGETTTVRNSLVAVTDDIKHDSTNSANARGIRVRHPAHVVIENCYFIYLDVGGASNLIEIEDEAAGSTIEIRNCTFYNESGGALISDDSGGSVDVTVEGCVAAGGGNYEMEGVDSPDLTTGSDVTVPSPGSLTGYQVANEITGVGPGIGPWTDSDFDGTAQTTTETSTEEPSDPVETNEHTLVLHASPDNPDDNLDVSFTVDGSVDFGSQAEAGTDSIEENGDGLVTARTANLNPDALDSYLFTGEVVDYQVSEGYTVDVAVDGTTTTFADLVGEGGSDGSTQDSGTDSGSDSSTDSDDSDSSTDSSDSTGSDGSTDSDEPTDSSYPNQLTVDGNQTDEVCEYTFTVSGDVVRDSSTSTVPEGALSWDKMEDIARDGKVIGVVGRGVDGYRYSGSITAITVRGDADIDVVEQS